MMSTLIPTVRVTNGVKQHVVVVARNKSVSDMLLRALFDADIVGLRCIDKETNKEIMNISCYDGQYSIIVKENLIYEIITHSKETTSSNKAEQKSNVEIDKLHSIREKSVTPTNFDDMESNKLLSIVDQKIDLLSDKFNKELGKVSKDLAMLYDIMQPMITRALDPWDITARSLCSSISSLSKQEVANFYGIGENECMVCGRTFDVVNAHIWPKHTRGENLLSMFGLTDQHLNNPRNYLRLCKPLELAFDNKSITIIQRQGQLLLFVLDNDLKRKQVAHTRYKFNDCHEWPLTFPNANRPFLRILAAHCRNAFVDAFRLKRIDYNTYKIGQESSISMLNSSPDGSKAKIFEWFERNSKMINSNERSSKNIDPEQSFD